MRASMRAKPVPRLVPKAGKLFTKKTKHLFDVFQPPVFRYQATKQVVFCDFLAHMATKPKKLRTCNRSVETTQGFLQKLRCAKTQGFSHKLRRAKTQPYKRKDV